MTKAGYNSGQHYLKLNSTKTNISSVMDIFLIDIQSIIISWIGSDTLYHTNIGSVHPYM